jgi:YidC/Oxa1 family membrane protein insertase
MIKLMFFPLSIKQQKNMAQMSKLQPKLKALQQRYKDDKQKLNQEIMGLYRQEKVNPLGGCLPLLIQFPVIIALYRVLGDALALRGAPFALWINDLSVPDTLFYPWLHILPILMGATMLIQNFISPASAMGGAGADPRQAQMLKFMPIIFLFIFWKFPAGLNLYWTVYTILGIGEQVIIRRQTALQEARAS